MSKQEPVQNLSKMFMLLLIELINTNLKEIV